MFVIIQHMGDDDENARVICRLDKIYIKVNGSWLEIRYFSGFAEYADDFLKLKYETAV